SLDLLENQGMRVLHEESRRLLAAAGAEVDETSQTVRFDRHLVMEQLRQAPPEFTLHARNPAKNIRIGGRHLAFTSVGGPAYCSDLDRGRRRGSFGEVCDYLKLVQSLDIIHQEGGGPFEPIELPPETRHLDLYLSQARLLDKNWQPIALGRQRARDAIRMARIALGFSEEEFREKPALFAIINTNSPLQIDIPMAEGLIEMARAGQACCITPFTLAGAMAPVTLAGTLVQQNAEALAGITLAQVVRPGAPVVYGAFSSNVDMRSGSPAFGTPEYAKAAQASGQLARRYGLPFRSSNVTSSNVVDAQSTYESAMSLWAAISGQANIIVHAAGWLEGGLTASFEKLIVDAEMLQMMAEYLRPIEVNDDTLALEAIEEAGAGGHFFGVGHTMSRYETAFYQPMLTEQRNFESWAEAGSEDALARANQIWKKLLREYVAPPLDPAVDEELEAYVARRKAHGNPG
ncbi:MAG: trimethylamine methyltransferase family protein, partial [Xanthomonadales bacterium]|nr:trimethylamine methyltransferase family protein [Xanthomonadales bacterium]